MVKHFSASAASCYLSCPLKWKFRYMMHLPEAPSAALERGKMVHLAMERYWSGNYGKPEPGLHRYISAYRRLKGAIKPEDVAATELELRAALDGVDVPILGYLDVLTTDGRIVDLKTAGKPWANGRAERELQPALYSHLATANGYQVRAFEFHILVGDGSDRHIDTYREPVDLDAITIEDNLIRIRQAWAGIVSQEYPAKRSLFCGYCDFTEACALETGIKPPHGRRGG